jgi:hypothetical protein
VQSLYLPLLLEHCVLEVLLPLITLTETTQLLPAGQCIPLQKVPESDDDDDETEKECAVIYYHQLMRCEYGSHHQNSNWNLCGLNYGAKRNERGRTCHILELQKIFQSNLFSSVKTT